MNTYYFNDDSFKRTELYRDFTNTNSKEGSLRIRAYAANQALPISGLKIIVSTIFNNNKIVFYEGLTDESGTIPKLDLPAPELNENNLDTPNQIVYEIDAIYIPDNIDTKYYINLYENICVIQNIDIVPKTQFVGEIKWL